MTMAHEIELVLDAAGQRVVGHRRVMRLLLMALACGGHVVLEARPGTAKTTVAKTLAGLLGLQFQRAQGVPDLLPTDIIGYERLESVNGVVQARIEPGPVMTQALLVDEINRMPPRTQAALLEAMAEGQVTIGRQTLRLPQPFVVIATQNPLESQGTFALPDAQLDRFLFRLCLDYVSVAERLELLRRWQVEATEPLAPMVSVEAVLAWRQEVAAVRVADAILEYISALVEETHQQAGVLNGLSDRAAVLLRLASQAAAACDRQTAVFPEQVKAVFVPLAAHRMTLAPEADGSASAAEAVAQAVLDAVPVPASMVAAARAYRR